MEKIILHSDMNNFYASVECMLNPELKGKYIAVCGNKADRHGIVLAKNQPAKLKGVSTGEPIWKAMQKCPELVIVPPHYDEYMKYSKLAREIYYEYTDLVEPYGLDECWLDVTGSADLFGSGIDIAYDIKKKIRRKLNLTVSIGVSFNKIFAKLGSDMKKPDAVTCIYPENFREKIWSLPVSDLLYVGPATTQKLRKYNIYTIGELALTQPGLLKKWFGKNGAMIWSFANGLDNSRVAPYGYKPPIKSIGHGTTCVCDLENDEQVWKVIFKLAQDVSHRLRLNGLMACGVALGVRSSDLSSKEYQMKFTGETRSHTVLAKEAFELYRQQHVKEKLVRALSVRAIHLTSAAPPRQIDLFTDPEADIKKDRLESTIELIRDRYGRSSITYAALMGDLKMPAGASSLHIMPDVMYR